MKIALCQVNLTTGDFEGNFQKAVEALENTKADVFVFPECQVTNYNSDDLFLNPDYDIKASVYINKYIELSAQFNTCIVFGTISNGENCAIIAQNGAVIDIVAKNQLPNYDIFDDVRWFKPGQNKIIEINGKKVAVLICEDMWVNDYYKGFAGADLMITLNASPYSINKYEFKKKFIGERAYELNMPIVYVNQVGGHDEIVYDGGSFIAYPTRNFFELKRWVEQIETVHIENLLVVERTEKPISFAEERYMAIGTGLRDYVNKNGFKSVVFGNSGGADSCLVAMLTADFLGPDRCQHIMMPSKYTSDVSNDFASALSRGLGVKFNFIPINDMFKAFGDNLSAKFGNTPTNVAEENLQAQIRGDILSWYSNKFGAMIVGTSNKTELAMGYGTLYGDLRGGFNPLKDCYKHRDVYELLDWRYKVALGEETTTMLKPVVLAQEGIKALSDITNRAPSAELAPGQKDTDSLPEYELLDNILWEYLDQNQQQSIATIADKLGLELQFVADIIARMYRFEFKRNQGAPGTKIHRKSFIKKDWRMPLTNKWNGL